MGCPRGYPDKSAGQGPNPARMTTYRLVSGLDLDMERPRLRGEEVEAKTPGVGAVGVAFALFHQRGGRSGCAARGTRGNGSKPIPQRRYRCRRSGKTNTDSGACGVSGTNLQALSARRGRLRRGRNGPVPRAGSPRASASALPPWRDRPGSRPASADGARAAASRP